MSDNELVELTDELVAELALKFGVTEDEIRKQYAETVALGADGALAQMDQHVAELEAEISEIADDAAARWLHAGPDRVRSIAEFYQEGWNAITPEEVAEVSVSDLFLKLSVAIFKLAEAREEIARLSDTGHRKGGT